MSRSGGGHAERWPDDRAEGAYRRESGAASRSWTRPLAGQNDWNPGSGSATAGRRGPRRSPRLPGGVSGVYGIAIVIAAAGVGALLTVLTGDQPGTVLGACLIVGTLAACSVIRPDAAHLIIPVPALAYLVAATVVGITSIPASDMSKTALAINELQWIAHGFLVMVIATAAAIAIAVIRRRVGRGTSRHPAGLRTR
jgi:hypothetical protein